MRAFIIISIFILPGLRVFSQPVIIAGTWRGTSICQVKNSPCHDEQAVYHVSKVSPTVYSFKMNKVVNGKEEEMGPGELQYSLSASDSTLKYIDTLRQAVWQFHVTGDSMQGTAVFKNKLYRVIKLRKE